MENNFKLGDTVKLISNSADSCNEVGDIGTITKLTSYDAKVSVVNRKNNGNWSYFSDLELYIEVKSIVVGSKVCIPKKKSTGAKLERFYEDLRDNSYYERYLLVESINGIEASLNFPIGYKEELYSHMFLLDDLELYEEGKPVIMNESALDIIKNKDIDFYLELQSLLNYLAKTYDDKYETGESNGFLAREILLSKDGKAATMFSIGKYLHRYNTKNFTKSELISDLYKSIHYTLFELQRRTKNAE